MVPRARTFSGKPIVRAPRPLGPLTASSISFAPAAPIFVGIRSLSADVGEDFRATLLPTFRPLAGDPRSASSRNGPELSGNINIDSKIGLYKAWHILSLVLFFVSFCSLCVSPFVLFLCLLLLFSLFCGLGLFCFAFL